MIVNWFPFSLAFNHTFTVAAFSRTHTPIVIISIESNGLIAYGEACIPPYLGESQASVIDFFKLVDFNRLSFDEPISYFLSYVDRIDLGNNAAKAAIDIAVHDLWGKLNNCRTISLLKGTETTPLSSFTIGIDELPIMIQKTREAHELGFRVLKLKIGTKDDMTLVDTLLKEWAYPFSVDVNQGWKDRYFAHEMSCFLAEKKALFIEQPFAKEKIDDSAWLTQHSPIPIIADESIKRLDDLKRFGKAFHGTNVKLMKSTGIYEAVQMIDYAKQEKLKLVLGCMAESSCATSAAAQLASKVDWVDLDAPYLIKNDPFNGMKIINGELVLNTLNGNGVSYLS
jgi:L-alanine-DL-glutamate epimerase-like enolase superfamily enzyme